MHLSVSLLSEATGLENNPEATRAKQEAMERCQITSELPSEGVPGKWLADFLNRRGSGLVTSYNANNQTQREGQVVPLAPKEVLQWKEKGTGDLHKRKTMAMAHLLVRIIVAQRDRGKMRHASHPPRALLPSNPTLEHWTLTHPRKPVSNPCHQRITTDLKPRLILR